MSSSKRICDALTIALFLGAICLPFVDEWQYPAIRRLPAAEFRIPARPPLLPSKDAVFSKAGREFLWSEEGRAWLLSEKGVRWMTRYPERYQAFHSDTFGYRTALVSSHCAIAWRVFGVSPNALMLRGKSNWIFTDEDSELAVWRGALPFSEAEVETWVRALKARRKFYAEHGIEYVFCVAPVKSNVYPEFMPSALQRGQTRLDQLLAATDKEDTCLLDLAEAVVAEKTRDRDEDFTYRRLGSHWTDRGARAASDAIIERLRLCWPGLPDLPFDAYDYEEESVQLEDDMGARLNVDAALLGVRHEYGLTLKGSRRWRPVGRDGRDITTTSNMEGLPRAWIQHDSFGTQARPFLLNHFGESECVWGYGLDVDRVLASKPDIVVELVVERALQFLPPTIPRETRSRELAERFAASSTELLSLPASTGWESVTLNERTHAVIKEDGLGIHRLRGGAGVWLPELSCPPGHDLILRIDLGVQEVDEVRVAYSTRSAPGFDARTSLAKPVQAGRNEILIELLAPELTGRIFVIPFASGRHVVLHAIEARAALH